LLFKDKFLFMNLQGIEPAVSLVWGMGRDDEGKVIRNAVSAKKQVIKP
jgi:hypothetical protein